jgi:predicted acetyltransferase
LPAGLVPCTVFWLVADGKVVGTASLRHVLNDALRKEGGHLGYCIHPSRRGQGLMKGFAPLLLDAARSRGIDRMLVTCADTNAASARVIEAMGGVLHGTFVSDTLHPGELCRRYWIDVGQG